MLLDESFRFFDYWDALEYGLYFIIIGYYALLFFYFLLMRFRTSKKMYWLFFSLLFLCLALGRFFFQVYYFFVPELKGDVSNSELILQLMLYYKLATFFSWLGIACALGILGILLFPPDITESKEEPKKILGRITLTEDLKLLFRLLFIIIPIIIGILVLFLPDAYFMDPDIHEQYNSNVDLVVITFGEWSYPVGRFILNLVLLPIFIAIIPFLFLYLAWKTFGVLRKSYLLNGVGFLIYYAGRLLQGVFEIFGWLHVRAVAPPLLILGALLLLVIANNYEQLK
ncbi:MAG: hypothetical protein EU548_06330 [Promethearchaeota archaeon]|nr:MAG: hypothetical protein EU548_06330 [Candidatus Lokiarchaeota archaeon]